MAGDPSPPPPQLWLGLQMGYAGKAPYQLLSPLADCFKGHFWFKADLQVLGQGQCEDAR